MEVKLEEGTVSSTWNREKPRDQQPLCCLMAAGLMLVVAAIAVAEPRAELLPPVAARTYVPRASSESPPAPDDPPLSRERDPSLPYPPTFSQTKRSTEFPTGVFNWLGKQFGGKDKKPDPKGPPKVIEPKPKIIKPAPVEANPQAAPATNAARVPLPAWRWYGYGAPTPGANALAPTGRYAAVHPTWYSQSGATPGAIPNVVEPVEGPMLPPPVEVPFGNEEPPIHPLSQKRDFVLPPDDRPPPNRTRQADLRLPTDEPMSRDSKPASIEMPNRPGESRGERNFTPILPVSARSVDPTTRAQAPESALVSSAIVAALKSACAGYASRIDLIPKGPNRLGIRLTVIPGVLSDRLADRIAKLPEFAGWEVEMHFAR